MIEPIEQLKTTLRTNGFSLTAPRRAVFLALQGEEALGIHELAKRCRTIDRASVYRCVALFEHLGIVQRLNIGWMYRLELTDAFTHHHHHLTCVRCGKIIPLPEDPALEQRLLTLARTQHFTPEDHQLEIRGLCAQCSGGGTAKNDKTHQ
jgi:Fur family ferric uptake transcriptional regulator